MEDAVPKRLHPLDYLIAIQGFAVMFLVPNKYTIAEVLLNQPRFSVSVILLGTFILVALFGPWAYRSIATAQWFLFYWQKDPRPWFLLIQFALTNILFWIPVSFVIDSSVL